MRLTYLLGGPGSGKTTVLAAARDVLWPECEPVTLVGPVVTTVWCERRMPVMQELGRHRPGGFSGTDALAMNVMPQAVRWIGEGNFAAPHLVGEGDRLASGKFFDAATDAGLDLRVIYLDVGEAASEARREARGSEQDPTWVKGRQTKCARLADEYGAIRVNGERPVGDVAAEVAGLLT